jgi:hypothetical protein
MMETGARVGAIQVGGLSGSAYSVPMALFADFLAIGAEMYAIGATISQDERSIATLAAEDWIKAIILGLAVIGIITNAAGIDAILSLMRL